MECERFSSNSKNVQLYQQLQSHLVLFCLCEIIDMKKKYINILTVIF